MNDESKGRLRERLLGASEARAAISRRAYEIYHQRGGEHGLELDDWLQAENEILAVMVEKEMRRGAESPATSESQAGTPASSAPRKKKTKIEQTAATEEKAPKKGARLIKR